MDTIESLFNQKALKNVKPKGILLTRIPWAFFMTLPLKNAVGDNSGKFSIGKTGTHPFQRLQFQNNGQWTKLHKGYEP